jgi:N-acylneuraminate cytidylyltransferase
MKITAIIPARGGSTRLKNKNIFPIWEKPMLYWPARACQSSKYLIDVWVSSDSDEILEVSRSIGLKTHKRSAETSTNTSYKQEAIREAAAYIDEISGKSDIYISLQANSPSIESFHIDLGIDALIGKKRDEIISVNNDLMQNAAFRIFKGDYVYQKDLSTNCGVVIADLYDVHTIDDVKYLEKQWKERK